MHLNMRRAPYVLIWVFMCFATAMVFQFFFGDVGDDDTLGPSAIDERSINQLLATVADPGEKFTVNSCEFVEEIVWGRGCSYPSGTKETRTTFNLRDIGEVSTTIAPIHGGVVLQFWPHSRFGMMSLAEPLMVSERRLYCDESIDETVKFVGSYASILSSSASPDVGQAVSEYVNRSCSK